jgi:hypothetical protein
MPNQVVAPALIAAEKSHGVTAAHTADAKRKMRRTLSSASVTGETQALIARP